MRRISVVIIAVVTVSAVSLLGMASGQQGGLPLARLDQSNVFTGQTNRFESTVEVLHDQPRGFRVSGTADSADRFAVAALVGEYANAAGQGTGVRGTATGIDGIGVQGFADVAMGGIGVTGAVANAGGIGVFAFNPVESGFGTGLTSVVHSPEAVAAQLANLGGGDILVAQNSFDTNVLTITNDGQIVQASSEALKTDVKPLEGALETVRRLNGVAFRWRSTGRADIGFLAEEVAGVLPEVVYLESETNARGLDYGRITAVLVEALKEQEARIATLEARIRELDRRR